MVQLQILNGKTAGSIYTARRFPFAIGRSAAAEVRLEDDGVWEKHARVRLEPRNGFVLEVEPNAIVSINCESVQSATLKNGDLLAIGSVKARFWLAPPKQRRLSAREAFFWFLVVGVSLGQVCLIYILLR